MSAAKTQAPDEGAEYFYYRPDLTIDPPLADGVAKAYSSDYFTLKQKKDEDVQMVDGEIAVVSTNVTTVVPGIKADAYCSGYKGFKKDLEVLVALVAKQGSEIHGQVLIRRYANETGQTEFWRIIPDGAKCTVQGAVLAFPDGSKLPVPSGEGL